MRCKNNMNQTNTYPNIIYILADDMGYGDLSCLNGNSSWKTPNLDRLAKEGLAFTDAHSTSAVCTPSRYSILTGRYNWRSRLKEGVLYGYSKHLIEPGRMTIGSLLQQSGYFTACIGKWHLGLDWGRKPVAKYDESVEVAPEDIDYSMPISNGPCDYGFDYFYGIPASLDMPPYVYIENNMVTEIPVETIEGKSGKGFIRPGHKAPDFCHSEVLSHLTQKVEDVIDNHCQEPFFIYYPMTAPHTPILPSKEFAGSSGSNEYGDFVLMCDHMVGRIMDKLEQKGIVDNTIVIFTSDNGCSPMADFEELALYGHNPSYVYRGAKADIYEGGHRIPFLLRWPARIRPGRICDETICQVDLMATIAHIVGVNLPDDAGEDSVSNLPIWLDEDYSKPLREATVHHSLDGSFSIRKGHWKLVMCPGSGGWSYPRPGEEPPDSPPIQLYDLSSDVAERTNVYREHQDVVEELTSLLAKYIIEGRSTPGKPQQNTFSEE